MVASCAGAALSCYLVSLRVASERAALESVETKIVLAQRDLRVLQTEIGTRGRLAQLERWNVKVLALSAPSADQFLGGSFELARLAQPENKVDFQAPVVLASAPAPESRAQLGAPAADDSGARAAVVPSRLLHEASLKTETREVPARAPVALPQTVAHKSTPKPATAARPAQTKALDKPGLTAAHKPAKAATLAAKAVKAPTLATTPAKAPTLATNPAKSPTRTSAATTAAAPKKVVDKAAAAAAKPVTKPVRIARVDPLAPLPAKASAKSKDSTAAR
jgi:hypothetical protein